jgi:phosphonate transport system ATP-binding protein
MCIECQNLETVYIPSLRHPILNKINLKIKPGEFVALLGLNGAGKSTLLRSILGLVPLKNGTIHIDDMLVTPRTLSKIRRHIGIIAQGGGLVRQLSAIDNVLCGTLGSFSSWETLWGFPKKTRERAEALLIELGLKDHLHQQTGKLSGGQQQRVAIARALIQEPKILLADEPLAGLDIISAQQVMDILAKLHRENGLTIVTVLHDLGLASIYPERSIILDKGQIVYDGNCENLSDKFLEFSTVYNAS